jgi:hypothetical protein
MRLLKVVRWNICRNLSGLRPYDNVRDLLTPRNLQPKQTSFDDAVRCVKSGWLKTE